jgi:hypothetical protein
VNINGGAFSHSLGGGLRRWSQHFTIGVVR